MLSSISLNLIAFILLVGIFLLYQLGAWVSNYQKKNNPQSKSEHLGPLESALLGLLALLLSFTFSMSAEKYDTRKALIVAESNNIGTVILRADLYKDSIRKEFRKDLQQYLEERIAYYDAGDDEAKSKDSRVKAERILNNLWRKAAQISRESPVLDRDDEMIPALNNMADSIRNRDVARSTVPDTIIFLLILLSLLDSFIIGYCKKEKKSDWIILSLYAAMMVITIYVIIDLDRPYTGIVTTDDYHQKILELRDLLKEG